MFSSSGRKSATFGEYDYGNGRRGRHPIRRRIAPGAPAWVRSPQVEPVVGEANEIVHRDDLHGERDRSFEAQMADLEVWE